MVNKDAKSLQPLMQKSILYKPFIFTGKRFSPCQHDVTNCVFSTAAAELQTQRPTESPHPERQRSIWIVTLTVFLLSFFVAIFVLKVRLSKSPYRNKVQDRCTDDEFLGETNPKNLKPSSNESLEHNVIKQEQSKVLIIS